MAAPDSSNGTSRPGFLGQLRNLLLAGLLALAPSAITLWVFFRLLNWTDNLLGRYLRFEFFDHRRIPGLGLIVTLLILVFVGWLATLVGGWIGGRSFGAMWEHFLTRIPGLGILYGSTKSIGEAFFTGKHGAFQHVVLVPWPHPGIYRIGFVSGAASPEIRRLLRDEYEVVFIPHTPNPASGFVHYVPRSSLVRLDWTVEEGLKVIVSGGVVQPLLGQEPPRTVPSATDVPPPGESRAG